MKGYAQRLAAVALVLLAAGSFFAGIVHNLRSGGFLAIWDSQVAGWFHAQTTPVVATVAILISFVGSPAFLTGASLVAALFLARRRCWRALAALVLTMGGGALLISLLKHLHHRPRPIFESPLATLASYGFPSGHVMGSMLFCGWIGWVFWPAMKTLRWRVGSILGGAAFVLLVALTRIYLGVHYLSDVLGAMAAGLAWLAFSLTAAETWRQSARLQGPR